MPKYLTQRDLENALSAATVAELFTDANSDTINQDALNDVLDRAEGEVDSWLATEIDITSPAFNRYDRLIRTAAVDFAVCFAFERHPEYVKTFGEDPRGTSRYKRAKERMERIQAAVQELPDQTAGVRPANVGAITRSTGVRTIVESADGTDNGAGF